MMMIIMMKSTEETTNKKFFESFNPYETLREKKWTKMENEMKKN